MLYQAIRQAARDVVRTASASLEIATTYRKVSSLAFVGGRIVADVRTVGGSLYVHLLDLGVGRPLYTGLDYEPDETAFLRHSLKPGMTAIDIGANVGYMTVLASQAVGSSGRVLAVEPDPGNSRLLTANIARNGCTNVTVCRSAVGSKPGSATLYQSAWNMGNHRLNAGPSGRAIASRAIEVPVETIDRLAAQHDLRRVDLIKMDIEGYEPGALAGMREIIRRDRPVVLTEFWPFAMRDAGFDPTAFLDTFLEAGYRAFAFPNLESPLTSTGQVVSTLPDQEAGTYANLVFSPAVTGSAAAS